MVGQELVGMLRFDAIIREHSDREMFEVLRHDHVAAARDRRRQHMPVSNIR
jgi:hypothetical protein